MRWGVIGLIALVSLLGACGDSGESEAAPATGDSESPGDTVTPAEDGDSNTDASDCQKLVEETYSYDALVESYLSEDGVTREQAESLAETSLSDTSFHAFDWNNCMYDRQYDCLVGGAPLNEEFADAIGADAYCRDAAVASETASSLVAARRAA